jgi:hypothetical protein
MKCAGIMLLALFSMACSTPNTTPEPRHFQHRDFDAYERTAQACMLSKGIECHINVPSKSLTLIINGRDTVEGTQQSVYDVSTLWCALTRLQGDLAVLLMKYPDGSMKGTSCSQIGNSM